MCKVVKKGVNKNYNLTVFRSKMQLAGTVASFNKHIFQLPKSETVKKRKKGVRKN
jgi:hypothetical protein